jgi:hypothetical protein
VDSSRAQGFIAKADLSGETLRQVIDGLPGAAACS